MANSEHSINDCCYYLLVSFLRWKKYIVILPVLQKENKICFRFWIIQRKIIIKELLVLQIFRQAALLLLSAVCLFITQGGNTILKEMLDYED